MGPLALRKKKLPNSCSLHGSARSRSQIDARNFAMSSGRDLRQTYEPLKEDGTVASGPRAKGWKLGHPESTVEWWKKKDSDKRVAIKFKKGFITAADELKTQASRSFLCSQRASNLVIVRGVVFDFNLDRVGLVFEYIPNAKTLTSFMEERESGLIGAREDEVRTIFCKIMRAVEAMHNNDSLPSTPILHRRIHPDNVLVTDDGDGVHVINWNYAKKEQFSQPVTKCDLGAYIAPEMTRLEIGERRVVYDQKVDVWSCGILLYRMVCGKLPFEDGVTLRERVRMLREGDFRFTRSVSRECQDLIRNMLEVDPVHRLSSKLVLNHEWVTRDSHASQTENHGEQSGALISSECPRICEPKGTLLPDDELGNDAARGTQSVQCNVSSIFEESDDDDFIEQALEGVES